MKIGTLVIVSLVTLLWLVAGAHAQQRLPPNGKCSSQKKKESCAPYFGCIWRKRKCRIVKTTNPNPTTSPLNAPTLDNGGFPPSGKCSSQKKMDNCNSYAACIWRKVIKGFDKLTRKQKRRNVKFICSDRGPGSPVSQSPTTGITNTPSPTMKKKSAPTKKPTANTKSPTMKKKVVPTTQPSMGPTKDKTPIESMCTVPQDKRKCNLYNFLQSQCDKFHGCVFDPETKRCNVNKLCDQYDCGVRLLALNFAKKIMPYCNGQLIDNESDKSCVHDLMKINDALELETRCRLNDNLSEIDIPKMKSAPQASKSDAQLNPVSSENADKFNKNLQKKIYVDQRFSKSSDGSFEAPFKTVGEAIDHSRTTPFKNSLKIIIIRAGTYYLSETIQLSTRDSNMVIRNYKNERVILSGAVLLKNAKYKFENLVKKHQNLILNTQTKMMELDDDIIERIKEINQNGILSALFINDKPAVRARYPNADPRTSGIHTWPLEQGTGFLRRPAKYLIGASRKTDEVIETRSIRPKTEEFPGYRVGWGGSADGFFTPPVSWFAVKGLPNNRCSFIPTRGVILQRELFKGKDSSKIIQNPIHFWPNIGNTHVHIIHHRYWGSTIYNVSSNDNLKLFFDKGGNQEARGNCLDGGADFFVENNLALLDAHNEFFLDLVHHKRLYYAMNNTLSSTIRTLQELNEAKIELTALRELIRIQGTLDKFGSSIVSDAVRNIEIKGLIFEKTYATGMDAHEVPSAGDWSITRQAALFMENVQNVRVSACNFRDLDGNGIFISKHAKDVHIVGNRFDFLTASAILVVGDPHYKRSSQVEGAEMWDMTNVRYFPDDVVIDGCFGAEFGIQLKQSAAVFVAISRRVRITNSVFFNGPRAGVAMNDGFGGEHLVEHNLMFNLVRETVDHGPFNTWDRQGYLQRNPYTGKVQTHALMSMVNNNFFMGNREVGLFSLWQLQT